MSTLLWYRAAARLAVTVLLVVAGAHGAAAQPASTPWWFENVGAGNLIPGCVSGMTLAGFEIDVKGRPALAWREDNGCGGAPRVFWTRFESGNWNLREFLSERRYQGGGAADHSHRFALRPSDGNPFIIYNDVGQWNEVNTYRSDLGTHPQGGVSTYLENVVPPQNCDYTNYSLAFGDGDMVPQWLRGHSTCNGWGELRLNGTTLLPSVWSAKGALAVGLDGTRHLMWNSGPEVFYARVPAGAATPDHHVRLFDGINRFGGEVRIAQGPDGILHAIVRGPDVTADWDLGAIVYLQSADGGTTWSPWEYVDPRDTPHAPDLYNANSDVSLAISPDGSPAIAYWRWNSELWYAKRDGPNGPWTHQLLMALPFATQAGHRPNQLRFDPVGDPIVAFYDPAANRMRLARPIPPGMTLPVDLSVTAVSAPAVTRAGGPVTVTFTVTNHSAVNVDGVVVEHRLPPGATLVTAAPAPALNGTWTVALTAGASRAFTLEVTAPHTIGTATGAVTVSSPIADATPADNAAAVVFDVRADECFVPGQPVACGPQQIDGDDLAVSIVSDTLTTAPTGIVTFTVAVTNRGSQARSNVGAEVSLTGAGWIDAAPGEVSLTGDSRRFALGDLAPGGTRWVVVRVMAPVVGSFTATAAHLNGADADPSNDTASATVRTAPDACFVPDADLVGRWRFDGDSTDSSGGRTAALHGTTAFRTGRLDRALSLDAPSGYAVVADDPALRPGAFTIAAWINPSSTVDWDTVVAKGASGLDPNMIWWDDTFWLGLAAGGYPTLYTYHGGGFTQETRAAARLSPARWYHLAATYDGSIARVYVDGVPVAESTIDRPLYYDVNPVPLTIGEDWQGGSANGAPLIGAIDDVTLHSRALAPGDVAAMVGGSSSECVNHPPVAVDDVVETSASGATANVLANDSDPDGDPIAIAAIVTPPLHGTASFDAQTIAYTPSVFTAGSDALAYQISDGRGGFATATLTIIMPAGTSISLQSSPRPSAQGATVTLVAHVATSAAGSGVPAGSVAFHNVSSNTPLGTAPLVAGTAALAVGTLTVGTNRMRASYVPSGGFLPSSVEIDHAVISVDEVIRNGDIETRSQFDAVGAVVWPNGSCSATLLTPAVALTAAQCVLNVPPQDLQFRISADRSAAVAEVLIHPQAVTADGFNLAFDVALVRLDAAAVAAWPALGYPALVEHDMPGGADGTAVGAASIGGNWIRVSGSLVVTQYLAGEGPTGNFFDNGFIETLPATAADQMFCARGTGGPLFDADGRITGVASFRFVETCAEDGPGYYLNLNRLRDWITTGTGALIDNTPPTTNMADLTLMEGLAVPFNISFYDADGDAITASIAGLPPGVTTTMRSPGEDGLPYYHLRFGGSPAPGSADTYPVVLTFSDGTITVTRSHIVTVRPPNQAPLAAADAVTGGTFEYEIRIPVLANDTDPEGDALKVVAVTPPLSGQVEIQSDGLVYRPQSETHLTESFTYTIEDSYGLRSTATVTVRLLTPGANLVARSVPAIAVRDGQLFDVDFVITNEGSGPVSGMSGHVTVNGLEFVDASVPRDSSGFPELGPLNGGESRTVRLRLGADTGAPATATVGMQVQSSEESGPSTDNSVTTTVLVQPGFCFAPPAGLRGLWTAESSVPDVAFGSGSAGFEFVPSRVGRAFVADGTSQGVGFYSAAQPLLQAFTLAAWTHRAPAAAGREPVLTLGGYSFSNPIATQAVLGFEGGHAVLALYDHEERIATIRAAAATPHEAWTHLAASYDGVTARLYVNGVEAGQQPVDVSWAESSRLYLGFALGEDNSVSDPAFNGLLDDLAVYERALSAAEVARMVAGDLVNCVPATAPAAAVAIDLSPAFTVADGVVELTIQVSNTGNGYLEAPELVYELPAMTTLVDASPAPAVFQPWELPRPTTWRLPPLVAGESATVTARVQAPPVDGVFTHRARVSDLNHGALAVAEASMTVASAACLAVPAGLTNEWRGDASDEFAPAGRVGKGFYQGTYLDQAPELIDGPAFSIAGWVRLSDGVYDMALLDLFSPDLFGDDRRRVMFGVLDRRLTLITRHADGVARRTIADAPILANRWLHLAASFDGETARLFLDGVVVASQHLGVALAERVRPEIGAVGQVIGVADEIVFYDRALEIDDMRRLALIDMGCPINQWPVVQAVADRFDRVGDVIDVIVDASDPDDGDTLTLSVTGLPEGLSFDPVIGRISGTVAPAASGTRQVTVSATDGRLSASVTFTWVIPHRVTFNVAQGGVLQIDADQWCDASMQAATCAIDVPDGQALPVFRGATDLPFPWATTTLAVGGGPVTHSAVVDVVWVSTFAVTFNRPLPDGTFGASVPPHVLGNRDYMVCDFVGPQGDAGGCYGQAMVGSTVHLAPLFNVGFRFTGFGGACTGLECALTITPQHQVVTASWERNTYEVTLDVRPGGMVTARSIASSQTLVCDGAMTGATCVIQVPTNTMLELTPRRPDGATQLWRWDLPNASTLIGLPISQAITAPTRFAITFEDWLDVRLPAWGAGAPQPFTADPPQQFTCGPDPVGRRCLAALPVGIPVTLRDSAADDATLLGWGGACSGAGTCTVTVDRLVALTAEFGYTTTITVGPGGYIETETGLRCSPATGPCSVTRRPDQLLRATAYPVQNGMKASWAGVFGINGTLTQLTVTIAPDQPRQIHVTFLVPVQIESDFGRQFLSNYVPAGYPGPIVPELVSSLTPGVTRPLTGTLLSDVPFGATLQLSVVNGVTAYDVFLGWAGDCSGSVCTAIVDRVGLVFIADFNRPPTALTTRVQTPWGLAEDTSRTIQAWFSDPDGDPVRFEVIAVTPPHLLQLVPGQVLQELEPVRPSLNAYGTGVIRVRGIDPAGLSTVADLLFEIAPRNDPPTLMPEVIPTQTVIAGRVTALPIFASPGPNEPRIQSAYSETASSPAAGVTFSFVDGQLRVTAPASSQRITATVTIRLSEVSTDPPQTPGQSNQVTRTFTLVIDPDVNTPSGANVQVTAAGPAAVSPITLSFPNVTSPGQTTYEVRSSGLTAPDGFLFGTPPVWFDIHTTAAYVAPVRVCITYPAGQYANPSALKLFHYEGGRWVDRTDSVDTKNRIVCGSVSSLSPFALAEPIAIEGKMRGEGRAESAGRSVDFDFSVAERKLGRERGRIELAIRTPKHGKKKPSTDRFESTGVDEIFFWDDSAFRPSRWTKARPNADSVVFTGTGKWNGSRGYAFEARATDQGEPGRGRDRLAITIYAPNGAVVATVDDAIDRGNIQSDRLDARHWR